MEGEKGNCLQFLYCAYFANPNGGPLKKESSPMVVFYADPSDKDREAKTLCARMIIPEEKELLTLHRYDTSKMIPKIVADFYSVYPEGEPLSAQEKTEIGLRNVTNLDSPINLSIHHSRIKKIRRSAAA